MVTTQPSGSGRCAMLHLRSLGSYFLKNPETPAGSGIPLVSQPHGIFERWSLGEYWSSARD